MFLQCLVLIFTSLLGSKLVADPQCLTFSIPEDAKHDIQIRIPEGWQRIAEDENTLTLLRFFDMKFYGLNLKETTKGHKFFILFYPVQENVSSFPKLMKFLTFLQEWFFPGALALQRTVDSTKQQFSGYFKFPSPNPLYGGFTSFPYAHYEFFLVACGIDEGYEKFNDLILTFIQSVKLIPKIDSPKNLPKPVVEVLPSKVTTETISVEAPTPLSEKPAETLEPMQSVAASESPEESELIVKAQEPEQPTPPPELPVEKKVVVTLERSIPQPNAEPSETAREMGTEETIEELENNTRLESND